MNNDTIKPEKISNDYQPVYRPRIIALVLLVVVLLIGAALAFHKNNSSTHTSPSYKFTYAQLVTNNLRGAGQGNGMSFQLPKQLNQVAPGDLNYISYYDQKAPSPNNDTTIAAAVALSSPMPSNYLSNLNSGLSLSKNSTGFKNSVAPIQQFIKSTTGYLYFYKDGNLPYTINLGNPSQVYVGSLSNGAWIIPFNVTFSKDASSTKHISSLQGEVIVAAGKANYYYLDLSTIDINWQSNKYIWSTILNSLKIDQ